MARCIGECEFKKTGKVRKQPPPKKEQYVCTACGHIFWMEVKEEKKKDDHKNKF